MKAFRLIAKAGGVLLLIYVTVLVLIFVAMHQSPDRFGQIMARVPGPLFAVLPFEPMWNVARGGDLKVGDVAPDFALRTTDGKSRVQLSSFRGRQPVVLVFGSYT
ncbi:MAG: hypothetical protein LC753_09830 [Acidobacteria bacterium]|nr:hypothetical protein [Acidobacteriota bacterium]MCA1650553.1 hypothetical protein [Acidobacteriota bacterium]